jgi:hypothetical protein
VTIGAIMTIELIGAVVQPSYGALARSSGVAWPPVRVFWVSWLPASPLTLGGIALLFGLGAVLLRDTAGTASRNVSTLADAIAGKPGPGA